MLHIQRLCKSFSGKQIIQDFNYELIDGTNLLISGPSGSGKSTLAQMMAGLDLEYQGQIKYDDMILSHHNQHQWMKRIQYVPQYQANTLDPYKTVYWTLLQPLKHFGVDKTHFQQRIEKVLTQCQLNSKLLNQKVGSLSGGQFQRLWIAKALLVNPDVLILDEATVNLDIINEERMIQMLLELNHIQLIMISHSAYVLERFEGQHLDMLEIE